MRLGSTSVILSRTFKGVPGVDANARPVNLSEEVGKVRDRMRQIESWSEDEHKINKKKIAASVDVVLNKIHGK